MDTRAVQTIIQELLEKLTLEVESVTVSEDAIHPVFSIKTEDAKKLIGNRGENLRAFNYIIKRIVEKKLDIEHPWFLVDVNGYQQDRNDEVRKKAKILIERVRNFKTTAQMDDLNAYERMLVHSMVAEDPEIETESLGEGRIKPLVIKYKEVPAEETL